MKSKTESRDLLRDDDSEDKTPSQENNCPQPAPTALNDQDTSAVYIRDKETGDWKVGNPAGSMAYNYLYRGDTDMA